ncbi:MAG: DUF885 domain-containing protein [Lachnospiraceae bacterium]|nr:DUF885 domain-containing protein [Lachnospiraceae bacterium]
MNKNCKTILRKSASVLLSATLLLGSLTACSGSGGKPAQTQQPEQMKESQEAFQQFTDEVFRDEVTSNLIDLHYLIAYPENYGIDSYSKTYGTIDLSTYKEDLEEAKEVQDKLSSFERSSLTPSQQVTYDLLDDSLGNVIKEYDYLYYDDPLKPTIGVQAELPTLLAEYAFRTETDVKDYLELMADTDRYFDELITYEKEKSEAGLFMSDACADMVIDDCESFLSQLDDHFLLSTFEERLDGLDGLTEKQKEAYKKTNQELVEHDIADAYKALIEGITALKGTGTNEGGLCNFEKGAKYYNYLLRTNVGTDRKPKDLINLVFDQLNADLDAIHEIYNAHPEYLSESGNFSFSITDPARILDDLQEKMTDDFPALTRPVEAKIKYVSESMEDALSPAFYLTPPIDDMDNNNIYINRGRTDNSSIYTTLAHEGYPGHLYQTVYSMQHSGGEPIRQLLGVAGYSEGWATYVEMMAYQYDTGIEPDLLALARHNNRFWMGICSLLDLRIHAEGYTLQDTYNFLSAYYNVSMDDVSETYYSLVSQPANYLCYYVGSLEFEDLKATAQKALGDKFSLKEFHAALLEHGDVPFYILRDYMKDWIKTQK